MGNILALMGHPPNNPDHDFFIIRGMLRGVGLLGADPTYGYTGLPALPASDESKSKAVPILCGMSMCVTVMLLVSCTRLGVRLFHAGLRWGADD